MKQIFGIDLGTTNSCISWLNNGRPEVIGIDGSPLVPSVVSFDPHETIVGQRARNRALLHPEETVASIKRLMGTDKKMPIHGQDYFPEDISGIILENLKQQAEKICNTTVKDVVITVPAYFSDAQRRATKQAGQQAGLNVVRIINEPTAAALFYNYFDPSSVQLKEISVLVYDLGGGTFDVSILNIGELTEVQASTGNTSLGGDDFDYKLVDYCLEHIKNHFGQDLSSYRPAMARLKETTEKAKITLSTHPFAVIDEPLLPVTKKETLDLKLEISRPTLESLLFEYLNITRHEVHKAMQESSLSPEDIEKVILVGGSTRIPAVSQLLEQDFSSSRMPVVDPDLAVAKGAAIQGGIISGSNVHQVLIDVTSHTLSTEALVDPHNMLLECVPIIPRNTQIPVTRSEVFQTIQENQKKVEVKVYQGESRKAEENTLIGSLDLSLAPAPEHCPVLLEYSYDLNGIIHVKVEQKGYSRKREVDLDAYKQNQRFLELNLEQEYGWEDDDSLDLDEAEEKFKDDEDEITNFILQKARDFLQGLSDQEKVQTLRKMISDYEQALKQEDEDLVDETEERLIDFLDELEGNS